MELPRRLAVQIALAFAVLGGVASYIDRTYFPVPGAAGALLRWGYPAALAAGVALFAAFFAVTFRSSRAALRARAGGWVDAAAEGRAAAAVIEAPRRLALMTLALTCIVTVLSVVLRLELGVEADLVIARAATGLSAAMIVALMVYSAAAETAARHLEGLGNRDIRPGGTVRGKLITLGVGLTACTVLLISSVSYAWYRADSDREYVERAAALVQEAAATVGAGWPTAACDVVQRALKAPTGVYSSAGELRTRSGDGSPLPARLQLDPSRPSGEQPVPGGWRVWRTVRAVTYVSLLPDAPLRARRQAFARPLLLASALLFAVGAFLALLAARAIARPLGQLGGAAGRIAAGDLTVSPASLSRDEFGRLAADFRHMTQGLAALVHGVQAASAGVADGTRALGTIGGRVQAGARQEHEGVVAVQASVEAMQSSVGLVSRGVGTLAEYVHSTSSAVTQLVSALAAVQQEARDLDGRTAEVGGDVQKLSETGKRAEVQLSALELQAAASRDSLARATASISGLESSAIGGQLATAQAAESADRAGGIVQEAVSGIEKVRAAVADAKRKVTVLGRRSDDIDHILDFVGEVAGRTNLLSLNASIIATQAGEHGKAFAVVADQIRELANQISSSTKSIGEIIRAVRDDVSGTARLIDRGDELAADGVDAARRSLMALEELRVATARGHESAAAILEAVQTHAASTREVSAVVGAVGESSGELSQAVKLIGRSVAAIGALSKALSQMVVGVSRSLDEQSGAGQRQLESLAKIDELLSEITRAVESHGAATRRVREAISELKKTTAQHEAAVVELSTVGDRLGSRSRELAQQVGRFTVD